MSAGLPSPTPRHVKARVTPLLALWLAPSRSPAHVTSHVTTSSSTQAVTRDYDIEPRDARLEASWRPSLRIPASWHAMWLALKHLSCPTWRRGKSRDSVEPCSVPHDLWWSLGRLSRDFPRDVILKLALKPPARNPTHVTAPEAFIRSHVTSWKVTWLQSLV